MTDSPRPDTEESRTTRSSSGMSPVQLLLLTAFDTTWRMFVPTLGGLFVGIGLDKLFNTVPTITIICLIIGASLSAFLVFSQLRRLRKGIKK